MYPKNKIKYHFMGGNNAIPLKSEQDLFEYVPVAQGAPEPSVGLIPLQDEAFWRQAAGFHQAVAGYTF